MNTPATQMQMQQSLCTPPAPIKTQAHYIEPIDQNAITPDDDSSFQNVSRSLVYPLLPSNDPRDVPEIPLPRSAQPVQDEQNPKFVHVGHVITNMLLHALATKFKHANICWNAHLGIMFRGKPFRGYIPNISEGVDKQELNNFNKTVSQKLGFHVFVSSFKNQDTNEESFTYTIKDFNPYHTPFGKYPKFIAMKPRTDANELISEEVRSVILNSQKEYVGLCKIMEKFFLENNGIDFRGEHIFMQKTSWFNHDPTYYTNAGVYHPASGYNKLIAEPQKFHVRIEARGKEPCGDLFKYVVIVSDHK